MREQLIQYVNLLFAGAPDSEEIKMEILQNTLDRYDDLIDQGKSLEAAYRLAISGIGDINEIIGSPAEPVVQNQIPRMEAAESDSTPKRIMRAVAIGLYILCPIPLFVLTEFGMSTLGLCGTLALVAVATALIILGNVKKRDGDDNLPLTPQQEQREHIRSIIWAVGLIVYFVISFLTQAWHITWLIFLIIKCVNGLVKAILDLKEAA